VLITVRGYIDPKLIVGLEELIEPKIAITSSRIEPDTSGL
jgi:hypothetical protein